MHCGNIVSILIMFSLTDETLFETLTAADAAEPL